MKKYINKLFPPGTLSLVLKAMAVHMAVYYIPKIFQGLGLLRQPVSMATALDEILPFVPFFILPYTLAFFQWFMCYVVLAHGNIALLTDHIRAELIAKAICLVCFIAIPTTLTRPEITGTGLFSRLTGIIYFFDTPTNLFPSMHTMQSWLCMRSAYKIRTTIPRWYPGLTAVMSTMVLLSTLLIKQHVIWDVVSGIAAAEIGIFAASMIRKKKGSRI